MILSIIFRGTKSVIRWKRRRRGIGLTFLWPYIHFHVEISIYFPILKNKSCEHYVILFCSIGSCENNKYKWFSLYIIQRVDPYTIRTVSDRQNPSLVFYIQFSKGRKTMSFVLFDQWWNALDKAWLHFTIYKNGYLSARGHQINISLIVTMYVWFLIPQQKL